MLPPDWLSRLRELYPRRDGGQGWPKLQRLIPAAMSKGADWERILEGTRRYRTWCARKGLIGTEYVMQAATFYGRDCHWDEWADYDLRSEAQIREDAAWSDLESRWLALGGESINRSYGLDHVRKAVEAKERQAREHAGIVIPIRKVR